MRMIKAQDGEMVVIAEKISTLNVRRIHWDEDYCIIANLFEQSRWPVLGKYTTKKQALQVLDDLNEWFLADKDAIYEEAMLFEKEEPSFAQEIRQSYKCFQIPADDKNMIN